MAPSASSAPPADGYAPAPDVYDEAFAGPGAVRPHYAPVLAALADADLPELSAAIDDDLDRPGVHFGGAGAPDTFHVDPVPRLLLADEWRVLAAGLAQRARTLNAFVADAYGPREVVA